jgi:DnaJ-class molecular chaperone
MTPDCYKILGVPNDATPDEIRAAYRRLARLYHPDLNSGPEAEARMQEINKAYDTLSNPARRRQHDVTVVAERHASADGRRRRRNVPYRSRPGAPISQRGEDVETAIFITQREAERGIRKSFLVQRLETCPRCKGSGVEPEETFNSSQCWRCAGQQRLPREIQLHATISAGVSDGNRLRLRGQGNAGLDGGPHGHVYITARVVQRDGVGRMAQFLLRHLVA